MGEEKEGKEPDQNKYSGMIGLQTTEDLRMGIPYLTLAAQVSQTDLGEIDSREFLLLIRFCVALVCDDPQCAPAYCIWHHPANDRQSKGGHLATSRLGFWNQ